jgi:SAM-dependent methyltransferase
MRNGSRKLNLGCFDQVLPGWLNTDITPHIYVSRVPGLAALLFRAGLLSRERYEQHRRGLFRQVQYLDVTRSFPYADATFDFAYSSHLLEHLPPQDALFCLSEIHRLLCPGGIVRISVPDLDRLIADYDRQRPEDFLDHIFESKQKRDKNRHHWHYNEISLGRLLAQAGFTNICRRGFQEGRCEDAVLLDNRPDSLFMEAEK